MLNSINNHPPLRTCIEARVTALEQAQTQTDLNVQYTELSITNSTVVPQINYN